MGVREGDEGINGDNGDNGDKPGTLLAPLLNA
jgi:hypothetical protein